MELTFTKKEKRRADRFENKHIDRHGEAPVYFIVNRFSKIGWTVFINCSVCEASKNITDYESWNV